MAYNTTAAFRLSLCRVTSEECVVLDATFPEVLSPVTRRQVKLNTVFAIWLQP